MPYTPDATDVAQPADTGVKATTAPAEFRTIKILIAALRAATQQFTSITVGGAINNSLFSAIVATAQVSKTSAPAALSTYHVDGVNNLRVAMFADSTAGEVGWDTSYSTGLLGYAWRIVNTTKMRLDLDGNLGINNLAPGNLGKFVVGDTNGTLFWTAPTPGFGDLGMAGGPGNFMRIGPANYADGGVMLMYTNSSGVRTIGAQLDRTGSVGIGRAPTVKLDVAGALALAAPTYVAGTTYTAAVGDSCLRIAASCTLLLPAAASFPGRMLRVLNVGAFTVTSTANNVVQQLTGTTGTAILPAVAGSWADLQSDGVYWVITASH